MFGIGMPEMLLILALALIFIGPKKLPDLAKSIGRALSEFKKATTEFKETMEIDTELKDVKKAFNDMNTDIRKPIDINVGPENKAPIDSDLPGDGTHRNKKEDDKGSDKTDEEIGKSSDIKPVEKKAFEKDDKASDKTDDEIGKSSDIRRKDEKKDNPSDNIRKRSEIKSKDEKERKKEEIMEKPEEVLKDE
ncbi:twin-arginine translocase TatA/TatE family subunit [Desulfonema magnum]|uniref:Sec-independent protein translocase protein TatA n=1 Tax=Desulfonema magnum TaxID=45655 RepID=A0A975GN64_9BACT|nr:Protein transocase domain-containing protein [Desulfonema magnum]